MFGMLDLIEHEVSYIRPAYDRVSTRTVGKAVIGDSVVLPSRAIRQARWTDDRPVETAGRHNPFHFGGIIRDITQERVAQQTAEHSDIGKESGNTHDKQATALHGGNSCPRAIAGDGVSSRPRWSECRKHSVVARKGLAYRVCVVHIARNQSQTVTWSAELLRRADERGHLVVPFKSLIHELPSNAAGGAENEKTH
jgi:hypothetical protein